MSPNDIATADTSLQPHQEPQSLDAEELTTNNEVDATEAAKSGVTASDGLQSASETKADVMRRMKSRSKSAIEHHSYHRERVIVDEDLYVRKYGFRQSKLFVNKFDQEPEKLSPANEEAYVQLRNLSKEDGARDLGKDRLGGPTTGHVTSQNRFSRSVPNLATLEGMERNVTIVEEYASEVSEDFERKRDEGEGEREDEKVAKADEISAQPRTGENVEKAQEDSGNDAKDITEKDLGYSNGEVTGKIARPDTKQNAQSNTTANANANDAVKENARQGTNEKPEKDAEIDSNDIKIGDARNGDAKGTISHAKENTTDGTEPLAKENAKGDGQGDANKNTKEIDQNTNENARPGASENTKENPITDTERVEGLPDETSEAGRNESVDLTANQVDARIGQCQTEGEVLLPEVSDIRGEGTQHGETNTKYQASCISDTETEERKEEKDTSKKSDQDTGAITRKKKKNDERNAISKASTEAARRTRIENSIHIELSKSRRREQVISPPAGSHRANARASEAMSAIDHHSYYRERTVVEEAPYIRAPYSPEYAGRDREKVYRRRPSISGKSRERPHGPDREREREEDREKNVRRQERDPEREWLERQLGQDMENRRRERLEAREVGRERIRRKEYHDRERDRNKERSRGADFLEVKQPSPTQPRSPSATSRRPVKITTEPRREQEKAETVLRPRIITIPPQPDLVSTAKLGVLGPKTYHYHPLKEMEFRLIKILPERMSILKTELLHRSLYDTLKYIAISYAWGDGVNTEELILDGAKVPVATSLHDALKAVRQKKTEVLVWVDALCIDQQNRDERASQVRLMGTIYSKATSTAVWLGPEADESELAMNLLQDVSDDRATPQRTKAIQQRIRATNRYPESAALFTLFKREYWRRLWCIQEVLLAKQTMVYCGDAVFPWEVYRKAAEAFWDKDSDPHVRQGPSSFPDKDALMQLGDASLLEVMRTCRKQLSENPRDKVFGILGLLPVETQREFPVDYSQSVKTVYTDVVDYLISTTDRLDVIRESIHFPINVNNAGLPSWCPDWSYIPQVSGLGRTLGFSASKDSEARYKFHDKRRKLEIVGIKLDIIKATGVAVGTFCSSQDYLMAFLHWRAIMLDEISSKESDGGAHFSQQQQQQHAAFCRTLCLGQVPENHVLNNDWHELCFHVFSSLIQEKFPYLVFDSRLSDSVNSTGLIETDARRKFLQDHFGNRMMGRSFCITEHGLMGMGSGYMTTDDIVVVPFGCSTPVILRPEGRRNEYRYIGDIYVDGYMHGEAVEEFEEGGEGRKVSKYMLC